MLMHSKRPTLETPKQMYGGGFRSKRTARQTHCLLQKGVALRAKNHTFQWFYSKQPTVEKPTHNRCMEARKQEDSSSNTVFGTER